MRNIKNLKISVTTQEWHVVEITLATSKKLRKLSIPFNFPGTDAAEVIGYDLITNTSLEELDLGYVSDRNIISGRAWDSFSFALCNTSSVMETFRSNHALQTVTNWGSPREENHPSDDIVASLKQMQIMINVEQHIRRFFSTTSVPVILIGTFLPAWN